MPLSPEGEKCVCHTGKVGKSDQLFYHLVATRQGGEKKLKQAKGIILMCLNEWLGLETSHCSDAQEIHEAEDLFDALPYNTHAK